jgi:AcrR family transcriptional regulator
MGLRARQKAQARELIAGAAWRLFAERGFDAVTVADVAREAQVSPATVFNYFGTKEDLLFFRLEAFGARLIEAIRGRGPETSVVAAYRRFGEGAGGLLAAVETGDDAALDRLRTLNRMVAASAALQARERLAYARMEDGLAELLAAEAGAPADDFEARFTANALIGVQRALVTYVRRRILADERPTELATDVRRLAKRAFQLLEHGMPLPPPAARA